LPTPFRLPRTTRCLIFGSSQTIDEPQVKANFFLGNTPTEWLTNEIPHNTLHYRAPDPDNDVPYHGHHIPSAGRIILGIGKQARSLTCQLSVTLKSIL